MIRLTVTGTTFTFALSRIRDDNIKEMPDE